MDDTPLAELSITALLDTLAGESLAPGAGSLAALSAAGAAAVVEAAARRSHDVAADAAAAERRAAELRERLVLIADATARAYAEAIRSLGREGEDDALRDARLGGDLAQAAYLPLTLAEVAAELAELAAALARNGEPEIRPDAAAATCLAEAAARVGAHLVAINLGVTSDDERRARADELAAAAAAAREHALAR